MATATAPKLFHPVLSKQQYAQVEERYLRGETTKSIADLMGCNEVTLRVHISRKQLPAIRAERQKDGRGERTKHKFAEISENIADVLLEKTPKDHEDLNLHADTAQKAAKIAALVHGWGEGAQIAVIVAGDIGGRPDQEAIEVESSAELATEGQQSDQD